MHTPHRVSIDYDEGQPGSYRAVVLTGRDTIRFESGDPQKDWDAYLAHAKDKRLFVLEASSVTHFVFDDVTWRFIMGEDGHEHLVPEDRPEWLNADPQLEIS